LTGLSFTIGLAKEYSHRYAQFDNDKITRGFNFSFHSFEDTIRNTIRWYAFLNKIKLNKKSQITSLPMLNGKSAKSAFENKYL
jgi:competence transcription factor ComK